MTPEDLHDFFVASAGVAGALVGLLFVALSVTQERLIERGETQLHRVRADAALTSFVNALVISLFGLIPARALGGTAIALSIVGMSFVSGSLLSFVRLRGFRLAEARDAGFLVLLLAVFVIQLLQGITLTGDGDHETAFNWLASLVIVCFIIGIFRAWEMIGGPTLGIGREARLFLSGKRDGEDEPPEK